MSAQAARTRARTLAHEPWRPTPPAGRGFARTFAMGDPQAPLDNVLAILDRHDLLGPDGRLRGDVALLSIGDHFDWQGELAQAAADGLAFLRWLAEHPPDQVVILAGNHDLSRVTELWRQTDAQFAAARALAEAIADAPDSSKQARFARDFPDLPTPEIASRDYSAFTERQRDLVQALLLGGRLTLGCAARMPDGRELLLTHAGITTRELAILGCPDERDPRRLSRRLADALAAAVAVVRPQWSAGEPARLALEPLHIAGTTGQEGGGLLYHRPGADVDAGPAPRRFDPHTLPLGLLQACGHAGHKKCREKLGPYVAPSARAVERGGLRTLHTDGARVSYEMGVLPVAAAEGTLYMIDAEMNSIPAAAYPLLALGALFPA
jgi:hypothetical protein